MSKQKKLREYLGITETQEPGIEQLKRIISQNQYISTPSASSLDIEFFLPIPMNEKELLIKLFRNLISHPTEIKYRIIKTTNEKLKPLFAHPEVHSFLSKLGFVYLKPFFIMDRISDEIQKNLQKAIELLKEPQSIVRQTSLPQQIIDPYASLIDLQIGTRRIRFKSIIDSGNEGPICMSRHFYEKTIRQLIHGLERIPIVSDVHPLLASIYEKLGYPFSERKDLHSVYEFLKAHETRLQSLLTTRDFRFPIKEFYNIIGCRFITGVNGSLDAPLTEKLRLIFLIRDKQIEMDVYILPQNPNPPSYDILFNVEFMHKMKEKKILPSYLPMFNIEFFEELDSLKKNLQIELLKSSILFKNSTKVQIIRHQLQISHLETQLKEIRNTIQELSSITINYESAKSMIFIDPYKTRVFYKIGRIEKTLETIFDTGNEADTIISFNAAVRLMWDGTGVPPSSLSFDNNALPSEIKMFNFIMENINEPMITTLPVTYPMIHQHLEMHKEKIIQLFHEDGIKWISSLCGIRSLTGVEGNIELIVPHYVNLELKIPHVVDSLPIRAMVKDLPGSTEILINLHSIRELAKRNIHLSFDHTSRQYKTIYQGFINRKRTKNIRLLEKIIDGTLTRRDIHELHQDIPPDISNLQKILQKPSKLRKQS